jgi:hypothetical protein
MMTRETVAKDILEYCKKKNIDFFTTKYAVGEVINAEDGRYYSSRQIAVGIRLLHELGLIKRISNKRWQILSYDIADYL